MDDVDEVAKKVETIKSFIAGHSHSLIGTATNAGPKQSKAKSKAKGKEDGREKPFKCKFCDRRFAVF